MTLTYAAVQEALNKIDANLDAMGDALLPSPYKSSDTTKLYDILIGMIPAGTPVKATYLARANDLVSLKEITGTVTGHSTIAKSEPFFHVESENGSVLLPGSLLEILPS